MTNLRLRRTTVSGLALFLLFATSSTAQTRLKLNFNPGWKMFIGDTAAAALVGFDDEGWQPVSLPHAFNEDDAFKKAIQELTTGVAWYRKHFRIPDIDKGRKLFLEFEGIRQGGEFYLNGQWIGRHENGVMAFGFDITDKINYGSENILAVRVDNRWDYREKSTNSTFEWNDRNFYANYGGINKNVYLHVTDKLYQTLPLYSTLGTIGIYVYAQDLNIAAGSATIAAQSQVRNDEDRPMNFQYEVFIRDPEGKQVADIYGGRYNLAPGQMVSASAGARVDGLHWWSWGYGYLYTVSTVIRVEGRTVDSVNTVTGFRKTEFREGMLILNDRAIQVKGYGQRTTNEWPAIGLSVPPWMSDLSNHLMVESNANLVRWMHVTPWKQDVESCDRVGLMESMPAGDAEKDVDGRRWQQRVELMRDAIIYNRNNPSIIFYECGNHGISEAHMREMKQVRDEFDPHGGRAIGAREMLNSKEAEYGGEMLYIDKSATRPLWEMEYSRDEGLRKYWDDYSPPYHKDGDGPAYKGEDARIYNRNQDSHAIEDVTRWYDYWSERPGTGSRVSAGGVNIIFSESNTHFRGAENYRRSGEVDALRIPKDGFYSHQVIWDGWVDIEKPRIHIIGHWNYTPGVRKSVYVVSNAGKVQLFVNDRSIGWGERSMGFLFKFNNVEWQSGVIRAVGYDAEGRRLCETRHETAGSPQAIRLTVHTGPGGLQANGADIALVDVEVTDAQGRRCPTDLSMIHFRLEGPAEWRGGMAQGPGNYILSKDLPVECGVNRVMIRSATVPGRIVLKAEGERLQPATTVIDSRSFEVKDGLAMQMPGQGLAANLDRVPTPAGASYKISRIPVRIVAARAGANADSAMLSYDDNETTAWHNDDRASTAWIEYTLERPAAISEINLKLNNFRTRFYLLDITIDGKEVFNGMTTPNLGYSNFRFPAQMGRTVKIKMGAAINAQDSGGEEINGKKLADGVTQYEAQKIGRLSIIEAEIYEYPAQNAVK